MHSRIEINNWVGVDACKGGWFSFCIDDEECGTIAVDACATELWRRHEQASLILVDIPIGLVDEGAERGCDLIARRSIGGRRSSVFPAPSRASLDADGYQMGSRLNLAATGRGLSQQSWAIVRKVREVDALLASDANARGRIREVHPEVLFWALNDFVPLSYPKRKSKGYEERLGILRRQYPETDAAALSALSTFPRHVLARDDVLDAMAAAVTAYRSRGQLWRICGTPAADSSGLPMEMVYWSRCEAIHPL